MKLVNFCAVSGVAQFNDILQLVGAWLRPALLFPTLRLELVFFIDGVQL